MRRMSARFAKPGMIVAKDVCDCFGYLIFEKGVRLPHDVSTKLSIHGVRELLIEDLRVADVPVQSLFPPEVEAEATQAMRQLLAESKGSDRIDELLISQVETPLYSMIRTLFPESMGEINTAGCSTSEEFMYMRPVKVAEMSLLMGKQVGYKMTDLIGLGLAAMLMDAGFILFPSNIEPVINGLENQETPYVRKHPEYGSSILSKDTRFNEEAIQAVLQHHERWDGSGYPRGIKGENICRAARIIAVADAYYELVSDRQGHRGLLPHSAIEYIMACSGELFDAGLVQILSRQVPLYPTGISVMLNTGEAGIISDSNPGHIGRPVVRVCYDRKLNPITRPFDIDLSEPEYQGVLVTQVIDY